MSAQMLEVSLSGVGTVPRLERDAWSMVKRVRIRQAINEFAPALMKQTISISETQGGSNQARTAHAL